MSLLTLPVELRAQIIDLVLCHERDRPLKPDEAGERSNIRDHNGKGMRYWYKVMYEDDLTKYIVGSASMLLINRQLHNETRRQMAMVKDKACYELDVIVNADRNLLPTWIRVPAMTKTIDNLNINFRIFGKGLGREDHHRVWNSSFGAPPVMVCNIYKLFERFFLLGASSPLNGSFDGSYRFSVKCLNINIERTSDTKPYCLTTLDCHPVTSSRLTPWEEVLGDIAYTWHPERFCRFLQVELANLLDMSRRTAELGSVLYQNIGIIKLSLAGVVVHGFELGTMLIDNGNAESFFTFGRSQVEASKWTEHTAKARRTKGIEPSQELSGTS